MCRCAMGCSGSMVGVSTDWLPVEDRLPDAEWAPRRPMGAGGRGLFGCAVVGLGLLAGRLLVAPQVRAVEVRAWVTVFAAICVQALPFLVFGSVVSAVIAAVIPEGFWARVLPRRGVWAVPVAGAAGAVLPGCECASVPVAGGLMARGVSPAAALAFLLSSPAINPVVLVATAVAFRGHPEMVAGRAVASLVVAVVMGWLWLRFGRPEWLRVPSRPAAGQSFVATLRHDLMHTGGFLVAGAAAAATINVVVPPGWTAEVAGIPVMNVVVLAVLAVLMSICSEADAFIAASLTQFSVVARLAFMVVGPMVDLKLIALQAGTFGRRFAGRFAPVTFVVAVAVSAVVGAVLL